MRLRRTLRRHSSSGARSGMLAGSRTASSNRCPSSTSITATACAGDRKSVCKRVCSNASRCCVWMPATRVQKRVFNCQEVCRRGGPSAAFGAGARRRRGYTRHTQAQGRARGLAWAGERVHAARRASGRAVAAPCAARRTCDNLTAGRACPHGELVVLAKRGGGLQQPEQQHTRSVPGW